MTALILAAEEAVAAAGSAGAAPWWNQTYPQYLGLNPLHVVLMMFPFWVSLIASWKLAIQPIMKTLEEREHRTEGARAEAADLEIKLNERLKAWETRLDETKQKAGEERQRIRKDASAAEAKVLAAAHEESATEIEKVRVAVEAERTRARADLGKQAEALARELAEKALGREIGSGSTPARSSQQGVRS